jgi:uncharacterized membrane protein
MDPAITVGLLWLLFGGTHIGLASPVVRDPLVRRLGERGFTIVFTLAASASFTLLVSYYASHRFEGSPGLALGGVAPVRIILSAMIVAGLVLIAISLWGYPRSAYAATEPGRIAPPRGIERVTRHSFFSGMVLLALAHALLAARLAGTVFFAGFVLLSTLGPLHQRRKLLARHGRPFQDYLDATSAIPFAAIVAGRQRLIWREIRAGAIAAGLVIAWMLSALHDHVLAFGGAPLIVAFVGGAVILILQSWRRDRGGADVAARAAAVRPKPAAPVA